MLIKIEKIFLITVLITLAIAIPEYFYMNEHNGRFSGRTFSAYLSFHTLEEVRTFERHSMDEVKYSVFNPIIQLAIIAGTLILTGIYFSMLVMSSLGLLEVVNQKFVVSSSVLLFWIIVFEVIVFLWKILK